MNKKTKNKSEKVCSEITREEAIKKMGKYAALTAFGTFMILNPKIEFPFSRFYGLTLSPLFQINKDRTYIGIGVGQMIGLLRKRK